MKALVLCGGMPQIALIHELKGRGIYTILADMNPNVAGRAYADEFYPVSVLDVQAVKQLAIDKKVDFVLTACADQVLLVQAQVSEELGLPCYIDYTTAKNVSSKELMKKVFVENGIPTSRYVIMSEFNEELTKHLVFPMIAKPVDSYSSRGVKKVFNKDDLRDAFQNAVEISRSNTAIVEEYVEGDELTVDVYVEDGKAHILCISNIDKIPNNDKFVICRTRYPAKITDDIRKQVEIIADKIAAAFLLKNSPMLIQMITDGQKVSVVEFCARTGGGDKFRLINQVAHFDVIKAVVDLTLGVKPHVENYLFPGVVVNEFLYADSGIIDHFEGFEEMAKQGKICEFYLLKQEGVKCDTIKSSGDRVAYYTIQSTTLDEALEVDKKVNLNIKVIDTKGKDILRHDLIAAY